MDKSFRYQVLFSIVLLVFTDLLYRFFPVDGFDHPYSPNENFGTWFDLLYGGADLYGHWVSFNAIPTAAHTIWGVLVGQWLMSDASKTDKFSKMLIAGIVLIILGYAMNPLIPIIKRISTASFVIASGGWSVLVTALLYYILDIKRWTGKWALFFQVVGMNSLFIYLFAHLEGADFMAHIFHPFTQLIFGFGSELLTNILSSLVVWLALWGICYWMYKKRVFIKI
jgi:predicted acyltransferase